MKTITTKLSNAKEQVTAEQFAAQLQTIEERLKVYEQVRAERLERAEKRGTYYRHLSWLYATGAEHYEPRPIKPEFAVSEQPIETRSDDAK